MKSLSIIALTIFASMSNAYAASSPAECSYFIAKVEKLAMERGVAYGYEAGAQELYKMSDAKDGSAELVRLEANRQKYFDRGVQKLAELQIAKAQALKACIK